MNKKRRERGGKKINRKKRMGGSIRKLRKEREYTT